MAVRELGARRIVYGSDAPGRSFASQLAKVLGADIAEADRRLILGENLRRLLDADPGREGDQAMIDVNVWLSRWPFRRLPDDEPAALVRRLRRLGVTEAWAGSLDALLHHDLADVNARLVATCRTMARSLLRPFGAVNPLLARLARGLAPLPRSAPDARHPSPSQLSRLYARPSGLRRTAERSRPAQADRPDRARRCKTNGRSIRS